MHVLTALIDAILPRSPLIPDLEKLAPPEELLAAGPHSILTVTHLAAYHFHVAVQCSDEKSLKLLIDYIRKYGEDEKILMTIDDTGSPNSVRFRDNSRSRPEGNPVLILAFVENVLKYNLVHTSASSANTTGMDAGMDVFWMYRKTN